MKGRQQTGRVAGVELVGRHGIPKDLAPGRDHLVGLGGGEEQGAAKGKDEALHDVCAVGVGWGRSV